MLQKIMAIPVFMMGLVILGAGGGFLSLIPIIMAIAMFKCSSKNFSLSFDSDGGDSSDGGGD